MRKIHLSREDKLQFEKWGYPQENISQIVRLKYRFHNYEGEEMTFDEAVEKFGRERVLGSIGRAAFHSTGSISDSWGTESNLFK